MRIRALTLAALTALLVLAAMPPARAAGRSLSAALTGAAEVPGPGDPDGIGTASVTVNPGLREVCWEISVSNITLPAAAAHIHAGQTGEAGPIVVTLSPPDASSMSSGCRGDLDRALLVAILVDPAAYYVNVHTTDFPGGAVRGQLAR